MNRIYKISYYVLYLLRMILYPMRFTGRENAPEGAAIVCANHSSYIDPILLAFAFGPKHYLRFMAKIELFQNKFLSWLIRTYGGFPIDRGNSDITAIRTAMKILRDGGKVMMFPEGTRVSEDDAVAGKSGAVRLAMKLKVPIVPVYITRGKKLFHRTEIHIGPPYMIDASASAEFDVLAGQLMEKIYALKAGTK